MRISRNGATTATPDKVICFSLRTSRRCVKPVLNFQILAFSAFFCG